MKASTAAGDPSPPPPGGWLSGLVSGAGRLLAAVLDPESSASDTTSSSPDSSQSPPRRGQPTADHGIGKCFPSDGHQLNLSGKENVFKDSGEGSLAIVSEIDPKNAVKQLLMQEIYSRSERDELIKIIQERVVDSDNEPAVILPIAWQANTQQHPVANFLMSDNIVEKEGLKKSSAVAEGPCTNSHDQIQRAVKRNSPGDFFEDARRKRNKSNSLRNHGVSSKEATANATRGLPEDSKPEMSHAKAGPLDGPTLETDMTHLVQKNTLTVRNGSCSVSNKTVFHGDTEAAPSSSMGLQTEKSSRNCSRGVNLQNSFPKKTRSPARRARPSNNGKTVRPWNGPPQQRNPAAGQGSHKGLTQVKRPVGRGRPRKGRK